MVIWFDIALVLAWSLKILLALLCGDILLQLLWLDMYQLLPLMLSSPIVTVFCLAMLMVVIIIVLADCRLQLFESGAVSISVVISVDAIDRCHCHGQCCGDIFFLLFSSFL